MNVGDLWQSNESDHIIEELSERQHRRAVGLRERRGRVVV
jgi:hypothetical protein